MIAILRGDEPLELRSERRRELSRAILDRRQGRRSDPTGYEVARDTLARRTHFKCAFCEKDLRIEGSPVEHFRPKKLVANPGEAEDRDGYWWLAWTWQNLLFACFRCNTTYKGNRFPRAPGTAKLPELSFELSLEQPLLIDPSRVDPRAHIRFRWSEVRQKWLPVPVDHSPLGAETIRVLGLDEDDARDRHVERIQPDIDDLLACRTEPTIFRVEWSRTCRRLLAPGQAFRALAWDMLDHHFPELQRRALAVELPAFPTCELPLDVVVFADPPEMQELDEPLALRVRALGARADFEDLAPLLRDILALRAWTDEQLARLFDRTTATIRAWRARAASGHTATSAPRLE